MAITAASAVNGLPLRQVHRNPVAGAEYAPNFGRTHRCPPFHDCFSQRVHEAARVDEALTVDVQRGGDSR